MGTPPFEIQVTSLAWMLRANAPAPGIVDLPWGCGTHLSRTMAKRGVWAACKQFVSGAYVCI